MILNACNTTLDLEVERPEPKILYNPGANIYSDTVSNENPDIIDAFFWAPAGIKEVKIKINDVEYLNLINDKSIDKVTHSEYVNINFDTDNDFDTAVVYFFLKDWRDIEIFDTINVIYSKTGLLPQKPLIGFGSKKTTEYAHIPVKFYNSTTNEPTGFLWNFGDNLTSSEMYPIHIYTEPGIYSVSLKSWNAYGIDSLTLTDYITILSSDELPHDFDGNYYPMVTIGTQTWMAQNLKSIHYADGMNIDGAFAYNNIEANADTLGRLYSWTALTRNQTVAQFQGVCPYGWHVPNDIEWATMIDFLGGSQEAGYKLKADYPEWPNHWNSGSNETGFTAIPAGEKELNTYRFIDEYAIFWAYNKSVTTQILSPLNYFMGSTNSISQGASSFQRSQSVRCIKN